MAKTKLPLLSKEAAGAFGKRLIYQRYFGKTGVKNYKKPTNPQTVNQQENRSNFAQVIAAWQTLSEEEKLIWNGWV